jgi:putative inorganic carbon (hco3(-)) transporter
MGHWWGQMAPAIAERYSLTIAVSTTLGVIIHYSKLKYNRALETQETLFLIFLAVIWATVFHSNLYPSIPYDVYKMTKVILIVLLASHVITTLKSYEGMLWVLILSGLFLAVQLYCGGGDYRDGRFAVGVGGSDFAETNFLAAHFSFLLPLLGIMFLKPTWKGKLVCVLSAPFLMNSIVLTRSRGAILALGIGILAIIWLVLRLGKHRKKVFFAIFLAASLGTFLTDTGFRQRMMTIQLEEQKRDESAEGRIAAWKAAWQMANDNPLGVGVGQFFSVVGKYNPDIAGRDTHNTYLRCLAELGFHGAAVLLLMIFTAFTTLNGVARAAKLISSSNLREAFLLHVLGMRVALIIYLSAAVFISSVYIEEFYWLLMFPVFLKRAFENELEPVRPFTN